ncbi:hypothetical protein EYR36_001988 [Pleurotus pulmonarius]|nr:hypothetical protein EYR36_001988 [Pleurotus pulmonarius]
MNDFVNIQNLLLEESRIRRERGPPVCFAQLYSVMTTNIQEEKTTSRAEEPRYLLQLEPPIGTSYWSVQNIPIFDYKVVGTLASPVQYLLVSWSCQCYIFTTNQKPDANNFGGSGGAFYIVMKHSGQVDSTLYHGKQTFKLQISASSGSPMTHLPDHSTKDGDNWTATIDYEQAMQMFNSGGNDTFTHNARYNETYQLSKMNQSGGVLNNTAEAVFQPDAGSAWYNTPKEIHGLSVFRQTEPSQWPLKFTFKAIAEFDSTVRTVTEEKTINLNFQ